MRITGLETFMVRPPKGARGGPLWTILKLTTDSGIAGYGEAQFSANQPFYPFKAATIEAMARDLYDAKVANQDPTRISRIMSSIYEGPCIHYPDASMMNLASAFDMCLWDILGKSLGCPVHVLLGGRFHERLRSYSYHGTLPALASDPLENLRMWVDRGLTAVKYDPVPRDHAWEQSNASILTLKDIAEAERCFRDFRSAVGERCDLLLGTHGQMSPAGAIRLAKALEPFRPLWFEEPVPPDNPEAMALVARSTSIPIATGERLVGRRDFARLLELKAAAVFQPDLGRVGGLTEAKAIADMAHAHFVHLAPHVWGGPILAAATIQLDLACPNFLIQESIGDFSGFHSELLTEPIEWKEGFIIPSTRPGLGYELNEAVARKHSAT